MTAETMTNYIELHRINVLLDFGFAFLPIESSLNISFQTIARIFAMMQCFAPTSLRLGGWLRCTWWAFAAAPGAKTALCPLCRTNMNRLLSYLYRIRILFLFMSKVFVWSLSNILILLRSFSHQASQFLLKHVQVRACVYFSKIMQENARDLRKCD